MTPLTLFIGRVFVQLAEATPSPVPAFEGDENLVTPGVIGFAVTFFVAIATVLLVIDMTRRVRRVRYRAEVQEKLAAERAEGETPTPASDKDQPPVDEPRTGGLVATRKIPTPWQRNAIKVRVWKISWKPNFPGNGFGRLRP